MYINIYILNKICYMLQLNLGCERLFNICEPNLADCIQAGIEACNSRSSCKGKNWLETTIGCRMGNFYQYRVFLIDRVNVVMEW